MTPTTCSARKSSKKKCSRAQIVSRTSNAETALRLEVMKFFNKNLKTAVEDACGIHDEDDSYFAWYENMYSIGCGVITSSLLKMTILEPEHVSMNNYFAFKDQKDCAHILR